MKGIYTALVTAFNQDGTINEKGMRAVVRHSIDHCQADGLFVGGTMGERYKMSASAVNDVFRIVADEAHGQVQLVANISALANEEILWLADQAKTLGYSKVGLIPPIFHGYTKTEIVRHYLDIADQIPLPLMIYVIPSFSKVDFTLEMLRELLNHPNIVGLKYTHNDYYLLDRVRVKCPDAILFTGFDDVLYHALIMGTDGAIGGTFNITGLLAKKLYQAVLDHDHEQALKLQRNINEVEDMLNETGLFPTIKATLAAMGVPCGELKKPSAAITEAQWNQGRKISAYLQAHE